MTDLLTLNDRPGEYPASYYAATRGPAPDAPPLDGDRRADVCIIGGGFTGLSAALTLMGKGLDVVLVEASRVGFGASGRNGGQVGTGLRKGPMELEKMVGADHTRRLWDLTEDAKATLKGYVEGHAIACDLKPGQLHAMLQQSGVDHAHREADFVAERYGYEGIEKLDARTIRDELGTTAYKGGTLDMGAAHLHPLNYALGLARAAAAGGIRICERTRVTRVEPGRPNRVVTERGTVTADTVLYGCNGYNMGLEKKAAAHVMPINNFIVATEPLGEDRAKELIARDVCVADSKFVVNYYRLSADRRMLFGGGETYGYRFPADIPALVLPNMVGIYPQLKGVRIDHAWGGTLGITASRLPYMTALDETRLTAGGFSGQGVAMATEAGKLMGLHVLGATEGFRTFASLRHTAFPGGGALRHPILVLAMSWYALRDRLGI